MTPLITKKLKTRWMVRGRRAPAFGVLAMLDPVELDRIAERILKFSEADETEVSVQIESAALTRFANNAIHQNVDERSVGISVRTVIDGRTARASTNKSDDDSLRRVIAQAVALARREPRNPDLLPMIGAQKYQKLSRLSEHTSEASPMDRAEPVKKVCRFADRAKQTAAGIFATEGNHSLLANSAGLYAKYKESKAEFSITILEKNSSGWAKASSFNMHKLDPLALARCASRKAIQSRKPKEIAPGRYTAILEPSAALDLAGLIFYDFSATAVRDKLSCLTGRMGKEVFDEKITVWDDAYHPLQMGSPYDGEGVPRQKVLLIDRGVPKTLVYSRAAAKKMKVKPTGHGFSLPNENGEAPVNLVFAGGENSTEEMIRSTERGILVTRVWYIREVDPYQKIVTGMTRDGTFLIIDGRITGGVRNFRFNQSIVQMLADVEMMGPSVRASGEEVFDMVVPAMKVRNFHFTEVTQF